MTIHNFYKAKKLSYDSKHKRKYTDITTIVIHNTANVGDTARENAKFFATGNTREAGAHFFIDREGKIYKSININRTAWAVGQETMNRLSVSIELCDIYSNYPSTKQVNTTRKLIRYIKKVCKNDHMFLIRHYDVTRKDCPHIMTNETQQFKLNWEKFKKEVL